MKQLTEFRCLVSDMNISKPRGFGAGLCDLHDYDGYSLPVDDSSVAIVSANRQAGIVLPCSNTAALVVETN